MKIKRKKFDQHLYHEIEDEEKSESYLDDVLPMIGHVVMHFNGMEKFLDSMICEFFTDRTDSTGLIVLHKMNYSAKVDLLKRFCDDFHTGIGYEIDGYGGLINDLKEAGRLRNLVVHADWENTDNDGYTYVSLKITKNGMEQEYIQFSKESLEKIIELIFSLYGQLGTYDEAKDGVLND
jgi:hypothetical protein